jgi:hypothetical protein
VVDVCAAGLANAKTYMKGAFESDTFAAADPPWINELLTPPQRKAYPLLEQKDPEQMRKEAQRQEAFEATMAAGRQLHEEGSAVKDAVTKTLLMEQLEQPAAEKERYAAEKVKEAETFTCKICTGKYTQKEAACSGSGSKNNWGFCSSKCRSKPKPKPKAKANKC